MTIAERQEMLIEHQWVYINTPEPTVDFSLNKPSHFNAEGLAALVCQPNYRGNCALLPRLQGVSENPQLSHLNHIHYLDGRVTERDKEIK